MSIKFRRSLLSIGLALLTAGAAHAQAPTARDAVPEKMPNHILYGAPISLERADGVLTAALNESNKHGWALNCAVYDSGANLVAFKRQDGAQIGSIDISKHKARTAVKYRRNTIAFENGVQEGGNIYLLTLDDVIASRGGNLIMEGGKIIGAIGCSGGTGSQDEVVSKAGIAGLK
jgi:glc operon protein GlcG